eukprot:TRINITY_DN5318_c1_g1_i4.p1 TRINITY_DN5318_c1_g1~~TRINITY_DN5318_c1_g1_i4.p1  ORF type:complete len:248 (-),score=50.58 TRINITY_DN5318_c1_g1_i4:64-807(-)
MSGTRDENIYMARIAEQARRYEDMVEYMKRVATMGAELSTAERNLFSVAYKSSVGMRRAALRAVIHMEKKQKEAKGADAVAHITKYRQKIEDELSVRCKDVIRLISEQFLATSTGEALVFWLKMQGDYHRYLAEFATSGAESAGEANNAYEKASEVANRDLPANDPIRLGLALNFSVFHYEVLGVPAKACQLAKSAHDLGAAEPCGNADSQQLLNQLSENLILWSTDQANAEGGKQLVLDGTAVEEL